MTKRINQDFFNQESEKMYYVLGTFYACCTLKKAVIFRSESKDLVKIIKDELETDHEIIKDNRGKNSYFIQARAPILKSKLEKFGLNKDKNEREFPNIEEKYLSHFVRGFIDGRGRIRKIHNIAYKRDYLRLKINFSNKFLLSLYDTLCNYMELRHKEPEGNNITFGTNDALKIRDFIYSGIDSQNDALYLPSKKELFYQCDYANNSQHPAKITSERRIEKAKRLLLKNKKLKQIAYTLGYSKSSLLRAFKKATGLTIKEYLQQNLNQQKPNSL